MTGKRRNDHSVLEIVGGMLALFVGFVMVLTLDSGSAWATVGLLLIVVGIVLCVLAIIQYRRNVNEVAGIVMGAAVKINNQPTPTAVGAEIEKLAELHATGALTDAEFATAKAKALES